MYINRILILLLVAGFLLAPSYQAWIASGDSVWYRPFLLWFVVIIVAYIAHQTRQTDDL